MSIFGKSYLNNKSRHFEWNQVRKSLSSLCYICLSTFSFNNGKCGRILDQKGIFFVPKGKPLSKNGSIFFSKNSSTFPKNGRILSKNGRILDKKVEFFVQKLQNVLEIAEFFYRLFRKDGWIRSIE